MTNINPLLDVMSEIDDSIITNTNIKKTKKRPLLIAAAAAAALTVITGVAGAAVVSKFQVSIDDEPFSVNIDVKKDVNLDPYEQLIEMGARHERNLKGTDMYWLTARPSEVFEVLNVPLLLNDNFTDEATDIYVCLSNVIDGTERGYLYVTYNLYDKETGVEIMLDSLCALSEETTYIADHDTTKDGVVEEELKLLDLNDGSKLAFSVFFRGGDDEPCDWNGVFSYGGIYYNFYMIKPVEEPVSQILPLDYDTCVQTLDHLGII